MGHQEFQERRPRVDLKRMKILDVLLIASILLGSAGWLLASRTDTDLGHLGRREVVVYHDGVITARMGLDSDNTVALLEGKMILEILDHRLRIKHSDCPRQFCVHQGWAKYEGES
ncbi:MAG: NusG domain II-containing protein, partial [Desulfosarcina sp.]